MMLSQWSILCHHKIIVSLQTIERKGPLFTLDNRIYLIASFQLSRAPHISIVTRPPTVPGRDLNPAPLSLGESSLLTELMRPDKHNFLIF